MPARGQSMGNPWYVHIDNPWTDYGLATDIPCIANGCPMKVHGHAMANPWVVHGLSADSPW
eukprot:5405655-Lingulodinium_polyedra.AAC.1